MEYFAQLSLCVIISISSVWSSEFTNLEILNGRSLINQSSFLEHDPEIYRLGLYDNCKVDIAPQNFTRFTNLQDLILVNNSITEVPQGIFNGLNDLERLVITNEPKLTTLSMTIFDKLEELNWLDLSGNNLTELDFGIFDNLEELRFLNLSSNNFLKLEPGLFNGLGNVERGKSERRQNRSQSRRGNRRIILELHNNKIAHVGTKTFSESNFEEIDLRNNVISRMDVGAFHKVKIGKLDLSRNNLTRIDSGAFQKISMIRELRLSENRISYPEAQYFIGLSNERRIKFSLFLDNNQIENIWNNTFNGMKLVTLDLHGNQIREIEVDGFYGMTVGHLDLSDNKLNRIEAGAFNGIINITHLDLSRNQLTSLEFGFFNGLTNQEKIHFTLQLRNNVIRSIRKDVFKGLSLLALDLCNNQISEIEAGSFSGLKVDKLNLSGNQLITLGSGVFDGIAGISQLDLSKNKLKSLEFGVFSGLRGNLQVSLQLENNSITNIRNKTFQGLNLATLDLHDNQISEIEAGTFSDLKVGHLDLSNSKLTKIEAGAFDGITQITKLDLSKNQLTFLESGTFDGLRGNLTFSLLLEDNLIGKVRNDTFRELDLLTLDLHGNHIRKIEPGTFSGLHVKLLNICYNKLDRIDIEDFDGIADKKRLYVDFKSGGVYGCVVWNVQ